MKREMDSDTPSERMDPSQTDRSDSADPRLDATISMLKANMIGAAVFVLATAMLLPVFLAFHGTPTLMRGVYRFLKIPELIPTFAVLIVVHELLHAAGFLFVGKMKKGAIRFGVQWKTLTPYAHCSQPMSALAYRIAVLLPGLLLGVVPCIIAVTIGSGWLLIWGVLMIVAAGGDVSILWAIRAVDGQTMVIDHPSKAGCQIVRAESVVSSTIAE